MQRWPVTRAPRTTGDECCQRSLCRFKEDSTTQWSSTFGFL